LGIGNNSLLLKDFKERHLIPQQRHQIMRTLTTAQFIGQNQ
jgi:hypothetical protein